MCRRVIHQLKGGTKNICFYDANHHKHKEEQIQKDG